METERDSSDEDAPLPTLWKGEMIVWKGVLHREDCQQAFLSGDYRCEGECLG